MDSDKKLETQINEYQALAKENPNVDVGLLMVNALQNQKQNSVSAKAKRWAYLISIGVPPIGLLFALRYYMADEDDAKQVAWMCVILTVLSIAVFFIFGKLLLSGSGTSLQQIQQIKPADVKQLYQ